ncbi:hypothetical protein IW261DRAFT_1553797 [Armillaria novae-zelandiae]|uniref:Uncharacterized protein n=1 Tax=Armillaria novae-zelandiae TaxID=153914 RepID=A0AA39NNA0_9AGAR|nr:hypothetical protein IW261DRAFT_1553797 [Armillaria novae-zelandiae]
MEAKPDYRGLPSLSVLVSRISTSPWSYLVFNHKLNTVWDAELARKVHACLDEMIVEWTRRCSQISLRDGRTVVFRCQKVFREFDIADVDVEMHESSVIRSADVQSPLTHALGLFIAAQATPYIEGTGGFFIVEGGDSKNLIVVTARHVVFPTKKGPNSKFERKSGSKPRSNNDTSYQELFASILTRIRRLGFFIEHKERLLQAAEGKDNNMARRAHGKAQQTMDEANETTGALYAFYQDVEKKWKTHASHVLGRVSPLPEGYSKDYAIIEGSTEKMYPNTNFKYPNDRLLKLDNIINDEELRHPTMLDQNDERCLVAIKNVKTTGVMSFYHIPKQWAILPYDNKFGLFSAPGDSSSVIVDGCGRIGGLLTGGAGYVDISYVTPIGFLMESIRANGYPDACRRKGHHNIASSG